MQNDMKNKILFYFEKLLLFITPLQNNTEVKSCHSTTIWYCIVQKAGAKHETIKVAFYTHHAFKQLQ